MSPPIDTDQQSYIDLDLKPIIQTEYEHQTHHFSHAKSLDNQHVCAQEEIDRPDLKLVIHENSYLTLNNDVDDIKLIFKSPLPSPPTSPHTSKDNSSVKPKKITSINAEDEDIE